MAQTPAPWKDGPVFNQQGRAIFWTDNGKLGKWNRRVDDKSGVFSAEDAALIVRAVNSHAALVAALEAGYLYALQWDGVLRIKNQETLIMMRSAIADATGRTDQDVQDDFESRAALAKQVS